MSYSITLHAIEDAMCDMKPGVTNSTRGHHRPPDPPTVPSCEASVKYTAQGANINLLLGEYIARNKPLFAFLLYS